MTIREVENVSKISSGANHLDKLNSVKINNHVRHLHDNHIRRRKVAMDSAKVLASKRFTGLYTGPYFDPGMPKNITAQMGDTALITCNVNQIGKFQVLFIIICSFISIMI